MRFAPLFIAAFFLFMHLRAKCQGDTLASGLVFAGYLEAYYSYDFANPINHLRPGFFYSFNRHNEVSVNLAYLKASYDKSGVRASLALMGGTYSQYIMAAEQPVFRHVLEASAGVKLLRDHELWIDAGIMPSHIGFESATGKVCWNLTRGLLAENSPYYESGAKLGYTSHDNKVYAAVLYLNGWQRIQRAPDNNTPAGGTQVTITPGKRFLFNWSTFAGNEFPDSSQRWRYFNNFYARVKLHDQLSIIGGFDIGMQQKSKGSVRYSQWYSPVLVAKCSPTAKVDIGARAEFYCDPDGVIIETGTPNGFQTWGYSLNIDYHIRSFFTWRVEGRGLQSKDPIFQGRNYFSSENYFVTSSLAITF